MGRATSLEQQNLRSSFVTVFFSGGGGGSVFRRDMSDIFCSTGKFSSRTDIPFIRFATGRKPVVVVVVLLRFIIPPDIGYVPTYLRINIDKVVVPSFSAENKLSRSGRILSARNP